ncbi:MAG: TetR/AcrR family transcriptional regulator [Candidatus Dormibacteria bacterium]
MDPVNRPLRQRRAELTESAILDASRSLFRQRGYAGTTIEQVAAEAGTATSTVYAVFGNKRELLAQLRWRAVKAADIPDIESLVPSGAPPAERLSLLASTFRRLYEAANDVFVVQRAAADADPEIATNWSAARRDRRAHLERILKPAAPFFSPGRSLERVADIVDALLEFHLYEEFVVRDGWSADEYEQWLRDTLVAQVLVSARETVQARRGGEPPNRGAPGSRP